MLQIAQYTSVLAVAPTAIYYIVRLLVSGKRVLGRLVGNQFVVVTDHCKFEWFASTEKPDTSGKKRRKK